MVVVSWLAARLASWAESAGPTLVPHGQLPQFAVPDPGYLSRVASCNLGRRHGHGPAHGPDDSLHDQQRRLRLAYAQSGSGEPIVKAANWLSHLEFDWQSPVWRHWFSFLSSRHTLLRYDARGCGLSDWSAGDLSLDAQVADLESVVAAAGLTDLHCWDIPGWVRGDEYACRHPRRVSKLVLFGAFPRGWFRPARRRHNRHARCSG